MDIRANLQDSTGVDWTIISMAIHMEINRFPRMYALVEGTSEPPPGAMTFTLTKTFGDAAAVMADLSESTWHVCASQMALTQNRCLLVLMPDPACTLQRSPFALNSQSVSSLISCALDSSDIVWDGDGEKTIESFVSLQETPELVARRVSSLVNGAFRVIPASNRGWRLKWGSNVADLLEPEIPDCAAGVAVVAQTRHPLEQNVLSVDVPCNFDAALCNSASGRAYWFPRPVQLGVAGTEAVTIQPPSNNIGEPLSALKASWCLLSDVGELDPLWRGAHICPDGHGERSVTLSSLFLYDGQVAAENIKKAGNVFAEMLGGIKPVDHSGKGWAAYALAVPIDDLPRDVVLLDRLLHLHRVAPLWQKMTQMVGCGAQQFDLHAQVWPTALPAVTIDNPYADHRCTVSLTEDGMTYRTKIWVQILGIAGELEVDWAVPFASQGSDESVGASDGDLLLVPTANTLGYVSFLGGNGAPYFHLNTHYRDVSATPKIKPKTHKHGLVTRGGLTVEETKISTQIKASDLVYIRATKIKHEMGKNPDQTKSAMGSSE